MILKELYLYPDLVEFEDAIVHLFRDQSRSICNYLERQLKPVKFDADGFKRICFIGKDEPNSECYVNSSKVLIVEVYFDEKKYKSLKKDQLNTFFSQMLVSGIEKCQKQFEVPVDELLRGIENFLENGCLNRWTFKTKSFKDIGVKCALECELTIEAFYLSLVFYKGKETLQTREILKTEPDEIVFTPMFKNLRLDENTLIVMDKFGDAVFSMTLDELNL